jgi:hypothetical protein
MTARSAIRNTVGVRCKGYRSTAARGAGRVQSGAARNASAAVSAARSHCGTVFAARS